MATLHLLITLLHSEADAGFRKVGIVLLNRVCGQVGWRHVYKGERTAGGQAGGEDDPFLLSSFPLKPSAARVEPAGVQPGESVAGGWHCHRGLRIWLLMEVAKMELGSSCPQEGKRV